jgi:hypothetical protein
VNETDWLAAAEPLAMLDYLRGKVSDRKLRLYACACVRRRWELLRWPTPRQAVELAERFAEGNATADEVEAMRQQAQESTYNAPEFEQPTYQAAGATLAESAFEAAHSACAHIRAQHVLDEVNAAVPWADEARIQGEASRAESLALGLLLHEVFGNPIRPVTIEPVWLRWSDGAVLSLARWIDEGQRFAELPYLADALTDAGCAEESLLGHLRAPGGHRRGCWALDAVLGRS